MHNTFPTPDDSDIPLSPYHTDTLPPPSSETMAVWAPPLEDDDPPDHVHMP
jgi:hypothetical protein